MSRSFNSWNEVNEGLFSTRGKHRILTPSGRRIKLVYVVQSNTQFLIKTVRANDVIDDSGKLTPKGAGTLSNFFNSQIGLVNTFGKLDANFFTKKVLVYKVVKDTERTEKIQFTIIDRSIIQGLDAKTQFISTDSLETAKANNQALSDVVTDTEQKAETTNTPEEPEEVESGSEGDAQGTEDTKRAAGTKFRYQMRSNNTVYLMEFTVNGAIDATRVKGSGTEGAVSWEDNKPMWYTNADDSAAQAEKAMKSTDALAMDTEITNATDKKFFTSIFTDDDFLQKIIDEYEEKYGSSEITAENLKNMMYHQDGTKIFQTEADDSTTASVEGTEGASSGAYNRTQSHGIIQQG